MAKKSSQNIKKISDILIFAGLSAAFSVGPAIAQEGGLSNTSPSPNEFSYEEAMKALEQTKKHSEAVQGWGERRTVEIPSGADPQRVIETELKKVPPIDEIGVVKPGTTSAKSSAPQEQSWDWLQKDGQKNSATSGTTVQNEAKKDDSLSLTDVDTDQVEATKKAEQPAPAPSQIVETQSVPNQTPAVTSTTPAVSVPAPTSTTTNSADSSSAGTASVPGTQSSQANSGAAFYNDAVKAHLSGKLDEAIAKYKQALDANPNLGQAHCNLGLIFNQQHKFAEALVEFQKALAIDPKDAITYNGIGAALRAQKDLDGAIKNWQTAVTYSPHLATAHYNLGTAYELKKDYDKALESYRQATANDFRLGEAYFRMGIIMQSRNQNSEAKEQFSQALKVAPGAEYSKKAREFLAAMEQAKTK